jgi:acyl-CoA hydrolase
LKRSYYSEYQQKLISPEQAAGLIQPGAYILYGSFLSRPVDFDNYLARRINELADIDIFYGAGLIPPLQTAMADPNQKVFTCNSCYFSAVDRKMHDKGLLFYTPANFSQANEMFSLPYYPPYTCVVQVAPMDEHGFFSFGVANTYCFEGAMQAATVIVEVNQNLPRMLGGSEDGLHISMVDYIIEGSNSPIFELPPSPEPTEADKRMAELILEEIPDHACLQLGGQLDFVQGAWYSNGGKSFLCLTSTFTDKNGTVHSRIVPTLKTGSIVTTPRTLVDYVVTEYGKVQLKGQPTWSRAEKLISLAHPDFRDDLIRQAQKMKIWRRTNKIE